MECGSGMNEPTIGLSSEVKLVISFDPATGQVNVNGPINDKLFCFGLLELAKEAVTKYCTQQAKQIMVARPIPVIRQ